MTREEAIKTIQDFIGWFKEDGLIRKALEMAIQALSQEPTIYPPCEDCRKKMDEIRRAYDKLKEQEPCEDAISREDARMMLTCEIKDGMTITEYIKMVDKRLRKLPSVTPSKHKGHWIECETNMYSCSYCSHSISITPEDNDINELILCPFCGAEME